MTDERSERLRRRRNRSTTQSAQSDEPTQPRDGDSEQSGGEETVSVKQEQIGTYMYLPESQTKDLRRQYNILKAEYEFEYDEEFEKNRHFYPLVVQYGLDSLEGLEASEIRERLTETLS